MTTAERLIKQTYEIRVRQIRSEELPAPDQRVKFDKLPSPVRQALALLDKCWDGEKRAKKLIEEAGFQIPSSYGWVFGSLPAHLSRDSTAQGKLNEISSAKRTDRVARCQELRTRAEVEVMGMTPTKIAEVIRQLDKDLAKV